jgi:hypothetical protein
MKFGIGCSELKHSYPFAIVGRKATGPRFMGSPGCRKEIKETGLPWLH